MMIFLLNKVKVLVRIISCFISSQVLKIKLKVYKCHYGKNLKVDGAVLFKLSKYNSIHIGDNVKINSSIKSNLVGINNYFSFQIIDNGSIKIGDNCGLTSTVFSSRCNISIGDNVKIGGNVRIFDHDYHSLDFKFRRNKELDVKIVKLKKFL